MVRQPQHELVQVVPAADDVVHQRQQRGPVGPLRAGRGLEVDVGVDHPECFAERPDLQVGAAERDRLVEQRERVAERAVALARDQHEALVVGRDALGRADLPEAVHDLRHRDAPEVEALRPGQDGGEHLVRLRGREDEQRVVRRLLQRLQERVERARREHVDLVEDVDLLPRPLRRHAHRVAQLADVLDPVVGRRVDLDDVERTALLEGRARVARPARLGGRPLAQRRLAVDRLREDARRRRLADAARPAEQVRVGEPVACDRIAERLGDVLLRDEVVEGLRPVLPGGDGKAGALGGAGRVGHRGRGSGGAGGRGPPRSAPAGST